MIAEERAELSFKVKIWASTTCETLADVALAAEKISHINGDVSKIFFQQCRKIFLETSPREIHPKPGN